MSFFVIPTERRTGFFRHSDGAAHEFFSSFRTRNEIPRQWTECRKRGDPSIGSASYGGGAASLRDDGGATHELFCHSERGTKYRGGIPRQGAECRRRGDPSIGYASLRDDGGERALCFFAPLAKIPQKGTAFLREPYSGGQRGDCQCREPRGHNNPSVTS